jgi:hypothetical protein
VSDIKTVLRLAKVRAESGPYTLDEYAEANKAIEAVETWLREVGALPPERTLSETHAEAAARKYPKRDTTLYGSAPPDMAKVIRHAHRKRA